MSIKQRNIKEGRLIQSTKTFGLPDTTKPSHDAFTMIQQMNNLETYASDFGLTIGSKVKPVGPGSTFETAQALPRLKNKEKITFFDYETIGDLPHQSQSVKTPAFFPTEFAFVETEYQRGKGFQPKSKQGSVFIQPDKKTKGYMENLIQRVKGNPLLLSDGSLSKSDELALLRIYSYGDATLKKRQVYNVPFVSLEEAGWAPNKASNIGLNGIQQLEKGMDNLNQATTHESFAQIFVKSFENKKRAGHNITSFDDPVTRHVAMTLNKDVRTQPMGQKMLQILGADSLDTLQASHMVPMQHTVLGVDKKLGQIQQFASGKALIGAHTGINDVKANIDVANYLLPRTKVPMDQAVPLKNGQTFYTYRGSGSYNPNQGRYNNHRGIFSFNTIVNQEGKEVLSRNFHESVLESASRFQILGQYENVPIGEDKIANYLMKVKNTETGIISNIVAENKGQMALYFHENNARVPQNATEQAIFERDRARRRYEQTVYPSQNKFNPNATEEIKTMYQRLDDYKVEVKRIKDEVQKTGVNISEKQIKEQAMQTVYEKALVGQKTNDPMYRYSYSKFKSVLSLEETLEADRPFASRVVKIAEEKFGESIERKNAFVEQMYGRYHREVGSDILDNQQRVGQFLNIGSELDPTYFDVSSPQNITRKIRQTVSGKNVAIDKENLRALFEQVQGQSLLDEEVKQRFLKEASDQLRTYGQIKENLASEIGDYLFTKTQEDADVSSKVIQNVRTTRKEATPLNRQEFTNGLRSNNQEQSTMMTWANEAYQQVMGQITGNSRMNQMASNLSQQFSQREFMKDHFERQDAMFRNFRSNKKINQQGDLRKRYASALDEVINGLKGQGYETALYFNEETNKLMLFTGSKEQILGKSQAQLQTSSRVGQITLPTYNKDNTVTFQNNTMTNRFYHKGKNGKQYEVTDLAEELLDSLKGLGKNIKEKEQELAIHGTKIESFQQVIDSSVNAQTFTLRERLSNKAYLNDFTFNEYGTKKSASANMKAGMQFDISGVSEEWLQQENPAIYRAYKRYQETAKGKAKSWENMNAHEFKNFGLDLSDAEFKALKNKKNFELPTFYNEKYGQTVGIRATPNGVSAKNYNQNIVSGLDVRDLSFGGAFQATSHERAEKTLNYVPLDREEMISRLMKEQHISRTKAESLFTSRNMTQTAVRANGLEEASHLNVRQKIATDEFLAQKVEEGKKRATSLQKEINLLEGTSGGNQATILEIRKKKEELGKLQTAIEEFSQASTYDGQMIVASDVTRAMNRIEVGNIKLNGTEVDGQLKNYLMDSGRITNDFDFKTSVTFEKPLSYAEMKKLMGKDKQLTVGRINNELIEKTNFKHQNYQITGFDAKAQAFTYEQKIQMKRGSKVLIDSTGRVTVSPVNRASFEAFGLGEYDIIGQMAGMSKGAGGTYQLNVLNTFGREIQDQLIDFADGKKTFETLPKALQGLLKEADMTDGAYFVSPENQSRIMNQALLPLKEQLQLQKELDFVTGPNGISLVEGIQGFQVIGQAKEANFFGDAVQKEAKRYGLDLKADTIRTQIAFHDTFPYGGAGIKVLNTSKEFTAIENILKHNGIEDSLVSSMMETLKTPTSEMDIQKRAQALTLLKQIQNFENDQAQSVVLDMSGGFKGPTEALSGSVPAYLDKSGVIQVDFSSPVKKTAGQRRYKEFGPNTADEFFNTISNPATLQLTYGNKVQTIGDLNQALTATGKSPANLYLNLPKIQSQNEVIEKSLLPILDANPTSIQLLDRETRQEMGHLQSIQTRIFEQVELLQGKEGPVSDYEIRKLNGLIESQQEAYQRFVTGTNKGGLEKQAFGVRQEASGMYTMQTNNVALSHRKDAKGNYHAKSVQAEMTTYLAPDEFLKQINGLEENIAYAMGWEDRLTTGDLVKADIKTLQEEIIQALDRNNPEAEKLHYLVSRQPVNSSDSHQAVRLLLDSKLGTGENATILMSPSLAKNARGDFDGDKANSVLQMYANKQQARAYNEALEQVGQKQAILRIETGKVTSLLAKEMAPQVASEIQTIQNLMNELTQAGEADKFFLYSGGEAMRRGDEVQTIIALSQKEAIGPYSNFTARQNDAARLVTDTLFNGGKIDLDQRTRIQRDVDAFGDIISQIPIGTKHIEASIFEGNSVAQMVNDGHFTFEDYGKYKTKMEELTQGIKSLDLGNTRQKEALVSQIESLVSSDMLDDMLIRSGSDDLIGVVDSLAIVNEPYKYLPGGMTGYHGKQGTTSTAYKNPKAAPTNQSKMWNHGNEALIAEQQVNFEQRVFGVFEKQNTLDFSEVFSDQAYEGLGRRRISVNDTAFTETGQANWQKYLKEGHGARLLTDTIDADEIANDVVSSAKNLADSGVSKNMMAFAGATMAVWGMSAMLRKAPTPEGNEAQQEASLVEVNPSLLLTSPTARVTPNAESVSLNIHANGSNLNHEQIASVVNQSIQEMSGMQITTNMNINDNTAKLNRNWYEKIINHAMGFGG